MSDGPDTLEGFRPFGEKMNTAIREAGNTSLNRFFALDSRVSEDGALAARTKELLGLVTSMVLCCDDYLALVVGGSIVFRTCGAPWPAWKSCWRTRPTASLLR